MANDVPDREPLTEKLQVFESLTFDNVLPRPIESRVELDDADVSTHVSKNVELNILILSAVMDTITESGMATGMAREGGLGVFYRNMNVKQMIREIERARRADKLVIRREDVVTANLGQTVSEVDEMMERADVFGAPVVGDDDVVLGIISGTNIRPYLGVGESDEVGEAMADEVITAERDVTARDVLKPMYDHKIERVPIVDDDSCLVGLATAQGILQRREHENAAHGDDGRPVCGVTIDPFDDERAQMVDDVGTDVIFINCVHAHSLNVIDTVRDIKESVEADVVVGNIGTREAAAELVDFTDGIKVDVGLGSVCTTCAASGPDTPQILVVAEAADVAADHDIPVIADGDIRYSGDTIKAVTADAGAVMLGSYFADTDEVPGRAITMNGKKYEQCRGMGSVGTVQSGSADRYLKEGNEDEEYIPEGVEAAMPYKSSLTSELHQPVGGMQSGMGYVDTETIPGAKERARFVRVSVAGQAEDHPYDMMTTDEASNYSSSE